MPNLHIWWGEQTWQPETMMDESSSPPMRTTTITMLGTATTITGDAVIPTASPTHSSSCPRRTILERLFPISTTPASPATAGTGAVVDVVVADDDGTVLSMGNVEDDVETGRGGNGREEAIRQQTAIMSPAAAVTTAIAAMLMPIIVPMMQKHCAGAPRPVTRVSMTATKTTTTPPMHHLSRASR
jgi:hypothetical protein